MSYQDEPDAFRTTSFLSAATTGDVDAIERLVAAGVSVNTCDAYGEPAILLAARLNRPSVVRRLLELGADLDLRGPTGNTLVHNLGAYPECVPLLPEAVRRGGDVNARDHWGKTPLMQALTRGCEPGAHQLLRLGADPLALDLRGNTALHHFVGGIYGFRKGEPHDRQLRLMRDLIDLGIDPRAIGDYGKSVASLAAEKGLHDVLELLDEVAQPIDCRDETGLTPLQTAAIWGQHETAEALLGRGANLDFISAVALGRTQVVQTRLEADPDLAQARLEKPRISALGLAIRYGHAEIARMLLEAGADPSAPDFWTSSLHNAVQHLPDPKLFSLLIECGADLEAIDGDANSPLNFAARADALSLATILLKAGANANAPTERGYTPMQFATSDAMRALLRAFGGR